MGTDTDIAFVRESVEKYRDKLLDTGKRNRLISFRHSERSRDHVRVIDEQPDFLHGLFLNDKSLTFKALPEGDQVPAVEKTPEFLRKLEKAKLTDEEYAQAMDEVDEDDDLAQEKIHSIERGLRNKLRGIADSADGMGQDTLTNAQLARRHEIDPSYEMPPVPTGDDGNAPKGHSDKYIQTLLRPDEMERKLSGLNSHVRTDIEETGVNTLYAAFGFVEWYESKDTDRPCISPLLLLQLEMTRKTSRAGYTYSVKSTGEEHDINLSLSECLKRRFSGLSLPVTEEGETPESYMAKVEALIRKEAGGLPQQDRWRVRRFITIGRFRFARLVMFHDLSGKDWPGDTDLSSHEVIQSLFSAGNQDGGGGGHEDEYEVDTPEVEAVVPLMVTQADASQHSAHFDVMQGGSLAIKGPPGTGKSQTITNMIANALAKGKTVLFLAEKMAALNVVQDRLGHAGLGPYCLELHSTKATKAEIFSSINKRLAAEDHDEGALEQKIAEFSRQRSTVSEYVNVLNSRFGRRGRTAHQYLWSTMLLKERLGGLLDVIGKAKIPFVQADMDEGRLSEYNRMLEAIAALQATVREKSADGRHPWGFVGNHDQNPQQQDELRRLTRRWKELLTGMQEELGRFTSRFKLPPIADARSLEDFLANTKAIAETDIGTLDPELVGKLDSVEMAEGLFVFVGKANDHKQAVAKVGKLRADKVRQAVAQVGGIESLLRTARELGVEGLTAGGMVGSLRGMGDKRKLFEALLGARPGLEVSEGDDIDKAMAWAGAAELINEVPAGHLSYRTGQVMDEGSAGHLETAVGTQGNLKERTRKIEARFHLSLLGGHEQLRAHAAELGNAGFLAFFRPAYRRAKRAYMHAAKQKGRFDAKEAAKVFHGIADMLRDTLEIEQDSRLQGICGPYFDGIKTDFGGLLAVNAWSAKVRKSYPYADEHSRKVRDWLLGAPKEELEPVSFLAQGDRFAELHSHIKEFAAGRHEESARRVGRFLGHLDDMAKSLEEARRFLLDFAASDEVTFEHIEQDIMHLRSAFEATDAADKIQGLDPFFGSGYSVVDSDVGDVAELARFVGGCLDVPGFRDCLGFMIDAGLAESWRGFVDGRNGIKERHGALRSHADRTQDHSAVSFAGPSGARGWDQVPYGELAGLFTTALDSPETLSDWVDLNFRVARLAQDTPSALLDAYAEHGLDYGTLPQAFEYLVNSAVVEELHKRFPAILRTKGLELEQARASLRELDEKLVELRTNRLCNTLNQAGCCPASARDQGARGRRAA